MAVLRSKRQVSKTEFENTFSALYRQTREYTLAIPRRRKKWLSKEIIRRMNAAYREVVEVNDYFHPDKAQKIEHIQNMAKSAAGHLYDLEKPLMVMWNVQKFETDKMARWVELINKEISLLNSIAVSKEATKCQQQWQHEQQQRQQLEWRLPLILECEVAMNKGENESPHY